MGNLELYQLPPVEPEERHGPPLFAKTDIELAARWGITDYDVLARYSTTRITRSHRIDLLKQMRTSGDRELQSQLPATNSGAEVRTNEEGTYLGPLRPRNAPGPSVQISAAEVDRQDPQTEKVERVLTPTEEVVHERMLAEEHQEKHFL